MNGPFPFWIAFTACGLLGGLAFLGATGTMVLFGRWHGQWIYPSLIGPSVLLFGLIALKEVSDPGSTLPHGLFGRLVKYLVRLPFRSAPAALLIVALWPTSGGLTVASFFTALLLTMPFAALSDAFELALKYGLRRLKARRPTPG